MLGTIDTLVIDTEVSGAQRNKGNPFDPLNKLVMGGMYDPVGELTTFSVDINNEPYGDILANLQAYISRAKCLVGFNIKFDLHWLRRYGIFFDSVVVWDCQIAHFLITAQRVVYPSLNDVLEYYGFEPKLDFIKLNYWDKGIDTDAIPVEELREYLIGDLQKTYQIYLKQREEITKLGLDALMAVCCQDLLVLQEMEWNGLKINVELSREIANKLLIEQRELKTQLSQLSGQPDLNWSSPKQVSALLYGGKIKKQGLEQIGEFKTGARKGQPKFRKVDIYEELPRLVEPPEDGELAAEGQFSTNEDTLLTLKAEGKAQQIIDCYLRYKNIDKLVGTYYNGLPQKIQEYNWEDNIIHHQLNQCVAVTGRLSSSEPNLQNVEKQAKQIIISRYN